MTYGMLYMYILYSSKYYHTIKINYKLMNTNLVEEPYFVDYSVVVHFLG